MTQVHPVRRRGRLHKQSAFFTSEWTENLYTLRGSVLFCEEQAATGGSALVDLASTSAALEGVFSTELTVDTKLSSFVLRWFDVDVKDFRSVHFGTADAADAEQWVRAIASVIGVAKKHNRLVDSNDRLVKVVDSARFFVSRRQGATPEEIVMVKYVGRPAAGFKRVPAGNFVEHKLFDVLPAKTTWADVKQVAPGHWRAEGPRLTDEGTLHARRAEWRIAEEGVLVVTFEFASGEQGWVGKFLLKGAEWLGHVWFSNLWNSCISCVTLHRLFRR
jgi:hypothetical protein